MENNFVRAGAPARFMQTVPFSTAQRKKHTSRLILKLTLDYGLSGSYCTITCAGDEDCPSEGHCGIPLHDPWQRWFAASRMSERFCVPGPRPEQRVEPVAMPESQSARRDR